MQLTYPKQEVKLTIKPRKYQEKNSLINMTEVFPPSCTNQKCNKEVSWLSMLLCIAEACLCSGFLPTAQSLKAF